MRLKGLTLPVKVPFRVVRLCAPISILIVKAENKVIILCNGQLGVKCGNTRSCQHNLLENRNPDSDWLKA